LFSRSSCTQTFVLLPENRTFSKVEVCYRRNALNVPQCRFNPLAAKSDYCYSQNSPPCVSKSIYSSANRSDNVTQYYGKTYSRCYFNGALRVLCAIFICFITFLALFYLVITRHVCVGINKINLAGIMDSISLIFRN